jgi:hypothetical protein
MHRFKFFLVGFSMVMAFPFLSSCDGEECIRCTATLDKSQVQEFCSTDRNERMTFQVDWIRQDYNCEQIEK